MKVLLDENISQTLQIDFGKHEVKTVKEMGWSGKKNGELLQLILRHHFDVLVTMDKNLKNQHNLQHSPITILVLIAKNNRDEAVQPLIDVVHKKLNSKLLKGVIEIRKPNQINY